MIYIIATRTEQNSHGPIGPQMLGAYETKDEADKIMKALVGECKPDENGCYHQTYWDYWMVGGVV